MEDRSGGKYIGAIPLIASVDTAPQYLISPNNRAFRVWFYPYLSTLKNKKITQFRLFGRPICLILSNR